MKQNDSYQDFDKQVQQLLGQASEPVPEGAWEAIAARLAAGAEAGAETGKAAASTGASAGAETAAAAGSARKAIVLKWARRAGFAFAAAAAVLLAVLLWNRPEDTTDDKLAVVTEQDTVREPNTVGEPNTVSEPIVVAEPAGVTAKSQSQFIASAEPAGVQTPAVAPQRSTIATKQSAVASTTESDAASSDDSNQSALVPNDADPSELIAQSIVVSSSAPVVAQTESQAQTANAPMVEAQAESQSRSAEAPAESPTAEVQAQPIDWDNLPDLEEEQQAKSRKKYQPSGFHLAAYTNALSNFTSKKSGQYTGYSGVSGSARPDHSYFDDENRESNYSIPLTFGLNVTYDILPRFSMGIGINYTRLSRHFAATYYQMDDNGNFNAGTDYDNVYNIQQFIGIPITAYYHIIRTNRINFYVYVNGTVEKCIGNAWTANNRAINYNEPVKGVQFNAGGGIGVDFMLAPLVSIYLDPNVKYYFGLNQPKSIRTKQPFMLGFEAGVRFHL